MDILDSDKYDQYDPADFPETVIIITERLDEGELRIDRQLLAGVLYESDYWKSQPDGEYIICMSQRGIRNRKIPPNEKEKFAKFVLPFCNKGQARASLIKIQNDNGRIWQVRIEEKY